jgi:hypothetical protein
MGLSIAEVDRRLEKAHERLIRADRREDLGEAAAAWAELDALLEVRFHLPLQRLVSE